MSTEEADYSTLPLEERLVHKVWKARLEAYQEITNIFQKSPNEESEVFRPYLSHPDIFKKIVTDSNVVAQESGIVALNALLEFGGSQVAVRLRHHVIPGLCEKGLSSTRAGTKQKTIDALLWFIDLDTPDPVVELMIPSLSAKLPKLVAGTTKALSEIYAQFGAQTVSSKLVLPSLPKLFSHADRNVRAEAQILTVELYKWLGSSLEQILFADLKPVQQKDLIKLFEKVQDEKPTQQRFLKSQRDAMESNNAGADEGYDGTGGSGGAGDNDAIMANNEEATGPIDPYDLVDPVNVLSKLPTDLAAKCSTSKWKDRVEALTEVHKELQVIKLADDDYIELIRILAKAVKDVNIQVLSLAANCIECLAKGLRRKFHKYFPIVLNPLLDRLKEKKPSVLDALNGALDSIFHSTSLSDVLEDVLEALKHKTPQVRLASCKYLIRCLKETREPPTKGEIESIITTSIKLVGDTVADVRTAGFEAVGSLMKITGERELNAYLEQVDDIKKKKILEFYEVAEVKSKLSASKPKPAQISRTTTGGGVITKKKTVSPSETGRGSALPSSSLKKKAPGLSASSTIPSKRGATSPLKQANGNSSRIGTLGNRGLTGRSLQSNAPSVPFPPSNGTAVKESVIISISAEEKEELIRLRREKAQWLEEKEKFRQQMNDSMKQTSDFLKDIDLLQGKIVKLNEQRTNDIMTIKSKDTQIQRFQSDIEISRLTINQLENEIELLQKTKSISSLSFNTGFTGTTFEKSNNNALQESNRFSTRSDQVSQQQQQQSPPIDHIDKRVGTLSLDSESSKENVAAATGTAATARPSIQFDTTDDSWRRAAEVTSQLKARIEKMKAKSRNAAYRNGGI
jgi:cytoskeleton-associated protein 5